MLLPILQSMDRQFFDKSQTLQSRVRIDQPLGTNNKAQACGVSCDGWITLKAVYAYVLWTALPRTCCKCSKQHIAEQN